MADTDDQTQFPNQDPCLDSSKRHEFEESETRQQTFPQLPKEIIPGHVYIIRLSQMPTPSVQRMIQALTMDSKAKFVVFGPDIELIEFDKSKHYIMRLNHSTTSEAMARIQEHLQEQELFENVTITTEPLEEASPLQHYHVEFVTKGAAYPDAGNNLPFVGLGLAEEAGECAGKIKKLWRDHGITSWAAALQTSNADVKKLRDGLTKELSDLLWYFLAACNEIGFSTNGIAKIGIDKLEGRRDRGTIFGEGDNR